MPNEQLHFDCNKQERFFHDGNEREHDDHGCTSNTSGNEALLEVETRLFMQQTLTYPLSLEPMQDPVVLCCTDPRQRCYGHVYDKQALCQSLLAHPNLDPKSNVRYTAPLFYVPCFWLQKCLQNKGLYRPYDDSRFATAYQWAWQRRNLFPNFLPAAAAAHHHHLVVDDYYNHNPRHPRMMLQQQRQRQDVDQPLDRGLLRYLWGATVLALYLNMFPDDDKSSSSSEPPSMLLVSSFARGAL